MDSAQYLARRATAFTPTDVEMHRLRSAMPNRLFHKSTLRALLYTARSVMISVSLFWFSLNIDTFAVLFALSTGLPESSVSRAMWLTYWWWQGIVWTGLWAISHEAGHGNLSTIKWINDIVGFLLHSFLLVPYYSWRRTHHTHHKHCGHMTLDESFVPPTRPSRSPLHENHLQEDIIQDMPAVHIIRLLVMQTFGLMLYLGANISGSPRYPKGTNHFSPSSLLFPEKDYSLVVISDIGIMATCSMLGYISWAFGMKAVLLHYLLPYIVVNHWVVLIVFLQHSDPTVPHYRDNEWTFVRGALTTVDRPVMGWVGRFFFFNICHDHVAHHLFYTIPFYNLPEATKIVREILKEQYIYDPTNCIYALWRSFTKCQYVDESGEIVMYKDASGKEARAIAQKDGLDSEI